MNVDPVAIIGALVLTVLAVLVTGPGMWSEKWGWKWLKDPQPKRPEDSGTDRPSADRSSAPRR